MEAYPLITIIIPSYNRDELLNESVNSALGQDYPNLNVIVIDDASEKLQSDFIRDQLNNDSRLSFIRLDRNMGAYQARNLALLMCGKAEGIMFLDSDDVYSTNTAISEMAAQMFQLPEKEAPRKNDIAVVSTVTKHVRPDGSEQLRGMPYSLFEDFLHIHTDSEQDQYIRVIGSLFRAELFRELGGFLNVRVSADDDLRNRLVAFGARFFVITKPLYVQQVQEDSLTFQESTGFKSDLRATVNKYLRFRIKIMKQMLGSKQKIKELFTEEVRLSGLRFGEVVNIDKLEFNPEVKHTELTGNRVKALLAGQEIDYDARP